MDIVLYLEYICRGRYTSIIIIYKFIIFSKKLSKKKKKLATFNKYTNYTIIIVKCVCKGNIITFIKSKLVYTAKIFLVTYLIFFFKRERDK